MMTSLSNQQKERKLQKWLKLFLWNIKYSKTKSLQEQIVDLHKMFFNACFHLQ